MNKYAEGKIYIIKNTINDLVYIGSTIEPLYKRMYNHTCRKGRIVQPIYGAIKEFGKDCFSIEELEKYPCESKQELHAREGYWIKQYDSVNNGYNCCIAGRTNKEYRKENPEKKREWDKTYNRTHKESIKKTKQRYYLDNKEEIRAKQKVKRDNEDSKICQCGGKYKNRHKKGHLKTVMHKNWENGIETVIKKKQVSIICDCGGKYTEQHKKGHFKTQKHLTWSNNNI